MYLRPVCLSLMTMLLACQVASARASDATLLPDSPNEGRPLLQPFVFGPDQPQGVPCEIQEDETVVVRAAGKDSNDAMQEGSFAALETEASHFSFVARILRAPAGTKDSQFGISIRAGTDGREKCVNLQHDSRHPDRCFRWFMRHHVTPDVRDGSRRAYLYGYDRSVASREGIWLRIVRRYPFVFLFTSDDGETWRELGADYLKVLLAQKVWVGLLLTAGGDGKQTVSLAADKLAFRIERSDGDSETFASLGEYVPPPRPYRMHLAQISIGGEEQRWLSPFLLLPQDMPAKNIRAILYTPFSRRVRVGAGELAWERGTGGMFRPSGMTRWEGQFDLEQTTPLDDLLAHHGIVRFGGHCAAAHYEKCIDKLARASGIAHLVNIPLLSTGIFYGGAFAAQTARLHPKSTVACASVNWAAGVAPTEDTPSLRVPQLHVMLSVEKSSSPANAEAIPLVREQSALWSYAPMWWVFRGEHKANALVLPYLLAMMDMRLPGDADYARGPVPLRPLDENEGWFGVVETWKTNFPRIVPVREYTDNSKNLVWLPDESIARLWQAFVSENPRTIIHFPISDGYWPSSVPPPPPWHNTSIEAERPIEVVASGPLGSDLAVEYYTGTRRLRAVKGENYRVTLEGLSPGLYAIYAITKLGALKEISRPVLVAVHPRR